MNVAGEPKPIATACSHQQNVQCRCFVTSNTILPILRLFRHSFRHQILNVIMCSLQVFADFLSCVVNFWPGDDFLGGSSAKTSIFPYNFLERQSCRDPYLSIRISRRGGLGQARVRDFQQQISPYFGPRVHTRGLDGHRPYSTDMRW